MSNETNEVINSTNDTETTENQDVEIDLDLEADEMNVEEDKDKLIATLKAQKDHWKKKATTPKDEKPVAKKESDAKLSMRDYLVLAKSGIEVDDFDDISEYASIKKISIADAMKSTVIKSILKEKSEQRQASLATNVSTGKRSVSKASEDQLIEQARKGEMPDSDEDMLRLVKARKGIK